MGVGGQHQCPGLQQPRGLCQNYFVFISEVRGIDSLIVSEDGGVGYRVAHNVTQSAAFEKNAVSPRPYFALVGSDHVVVGAAFAVAGR